MTTKQLLLAGVVVVLAVLFIAGVAMAQESCVYSFGSSAPWYMYNMSNPGAPNAIPISIQPYDGNPECDNASATVIYELVNAYTGKVALNLTDTVSWTDYAVQGYWLPFNNPGVGVYYAVIWVVSNGVVSVPLNFSCIGVSCPSPVYLFVENIEAVSANVTPTTVITRPGATYNLTVCFTFNGTFGGELPIYNYLNGSVTLNTDINVTPGTSMCQVLNLTAPSTPGTYIGRIYTPDPASATYTLIVQSPSTTSTKPTVVAPVGISVSPTNQTVVVGSSFTEYVTLLLNGTANANTVYYVNVTFNGVTTQVPITVQAGQSSGTNYVVLKAPDAVGVYTGFASYDGLSASFYVDTVNTTLHPSPTALWVVPQNQTVPIYSEFAITVYMNISAPAPATLTYNVTINFAGYPAFTVPVVVSQGSTTSQGTVVYMYAPGTPGVYQGIASYGGLSYEFYVTTVNVTGLTINFTVYPTTVYVQPNQRFSVNVTATLSKALNYVSGFLLTASLASYNLTTWFTVPPNATSAVMTVPFTAPPTPGIYTAYVYVGGRELTVTVYDGVYPTTQSILTNPLFLLLLLLVVFAIAVLAFRRRRRHGRGGTHVIDI